MVIYGVWLMGQRCIGYIQATAHLYRDVYMHMKMKIALELPCSAIHCPRKPRTNVLTRFILPSLPHHHSAPNLLAPLQHRFLGRYISPKREIRKLQLDRASYSARGVVCGRDTIIECLVGDNKSPLHIGRGFRAANMITSMFAVLLLFTTSRGSAFSL